MKGVLGIARFSKWITKIYGRYFQNGLRQLQITAIIHKINKSNNSNNNNNKLYTFKFTVFSLTSLYHEDYSFLVGRVNGKL